MGKIYINTLSVIVASFTDAWIETIGAGRRQKRAMSHLLQMRGLKPLSHFKDILKARRIFYRCVDWNPNMGINEDDAFVASFTDAWIETDAEAKSILVTMVASFTDAWIETEFKR